jgi:DNA processing protein
MSRAGLKSLGLSAEILYYIRGGWAHKDAEKVLEEARGKGMQILTTDHPDYPELLSRIFDPPLILYILGNLQLLSMPMIAVVGSRKCSVYGEEVAEVLSRDLARLGLGIVSGMALGIDTKAHQGALAVGGATLAVMGTGADFVYPRSSRKLYRRIREQGCILSEFPPGTLPTPQNFPIRNRIISGLALGTVIPEASEFSGSLITARLTLEQNRELWAVPGNITSPGSFGPNHLIKQGAKPLLCSQDLLEDLPVEVLNRLKRELGSDNEGKREEECDPGGREILELLDCDRTEHFDRLLELSGRSVTELSAILVGLEARGRIRVFPGRRYARRLDTVSLKKQGPKTGRAPTRCENHGAD